MNRTRKIPRMGVMIKGGECNIQFTCVSQEQIPAFSFFNLISFTSFELLLQTCTHFD